MLAFGAAFAGGTGAGVGATLGGTGTSGAAIAGVGVWLDGVVIVVMV